MANQYNYNYDSDEKPYQPRKLPTNRSMWKLMLLSLLTCGVYPFFFFMPLAADLDKVAPKSDRSKTMSFAAAYIIAFFTAGIVMTIWHYEIATRVEEALEKRQIDYEFTKGDFWGWYFFGSFILVGPFVYFHKLCKAMNLLCASYNENPVIAE